MSFIKHIRVNIACWVSGWILNIILYSKRSFKFPHSEHIWVKIKWSPFAEYILKSIFLNDNYCFWINISLQFIPYDPIDE